MSRMISEDSSQGKEEKRYAEIKGPYLQRSIRKSIEAFFIDNSARLQREMTISNGLLRFSLQQQKSLIISSFGVFQRLCIRFLGLWEFAWVV